LDEYFVQAVDKVDHTLFEKMVGEQELAGYMAIENQDYEKKTTPIIYRVLQHFDISEQEFISNMEAEATRLEALGIDPGFCDDWMIDALYCGDEDEMREELMTPITLYANEELFNVYEVLYGDSDELAALGMSQSEWEDYYERVESELSEILGDIGSSEFRDLDEKVEYIATGDTTAFIYPETITSSEANFLVSISNVTPITMFGWGLGDSSDNRVNLALVDEFEIGPVPPGHVFAYASEWGYEIDTYGGAKTYALKNANYALTFEAESEDAEVTVTMKKIWVENGEIFTEDYPAQVDHYDSTYIVSIMAE
jgi:hypothetical protein